MLHCVKKLLNSGKNLPKNPAIGTSLGNDVYKIRISIAFKNKGKSGGARVITFVKIVAETVFLLSIYNKGEKDTISNEEVNTLLKNHL